MAQAVIMPKMGQTQEEGLIVRWRKREGDTVKEGDILFDIETDKAVLEVESFFSGTLLKVLAHEGETVPVSTPVAFVGKPGEKVPAAPCAKREEPAQRIAPVPQSRASSGAERAPVTDESKLPFASAAPRRTAPVAPAPQAGQRLFISPRARALAKRRAVDPSRITGTGPDGRIAARDVESYLKARNYDKIRISPSARALAVKEGIDILTARGTGDSGRIALRDIERAIAERPRQMSKMRHVIARRLTESFTTTPHFYVTVSVDMTDLFALREKLKEKGANYTVTDFVLKAVVQSLVEFPALNSVTDGLTVRWHSSVDLGIAVALEDGLVVPVVRNAQELSLGELHDCVASLAAKARDGKLLPDEMTGSTFTVSNMGMFDVDTFAAIINPGESAILAVGTARKSAAPVNGKIKIRTIMRMTLSADHRMVDGALASKFVNAIRAKLEDIELCRSLT